MREYLTLHRSVFPSYLTIESGRMNLLAIGINTLYFWFKYDLEQIEVPSTPSSTPPGFEFMTS